MSSNNAYKLYNIWTSYKSYLCRSRIDIRLEKCNGAYLFPCFCVAGFIAFLFVVIPIKVT